MVYFDPLKRQYAFDHLLYFTKAVNHAQRRDWFRVFKVYKRKLLKKVLKF